MEQIAIILVWTVNFITGAGLMLLGWVMLRRPERVWVGVRIVRSPEEVARVRRANQWAAPWMLFLGAAEVLSGPLGVVADISPLMLAVGGLGALLLAIFTLVVTALMSR